MKKLSILRLVLMIPTLVFVYIGLLFLLGDANRLLAHQVQRTAPNPARPISQPEVFISLQEALSFKATAYNALQEQTDSTPNITATGTRTRPGIVAASRDVLEALPYGSLVRVVDVSSHEDAPNGCEGSLEQLKSLSPHDGAVFRIEDTMHRRKQEQVDFFMSEPNDARTWGVCKITLVHVKRNSTLAAR